MGTGITNVIGGPHDFLPITHFEVIALFSSNFQNFNTFRPLFKIL
jgi:hypothetical protein